MAVAFADDMVEELLDRISKGQPLTRITADPRMPARSSVYSWVESDEEFAGRFRAARARGVHALAEECLEIADEAPKDAVHVADKRVRIDTRLRLAGKWLPKEYGDKLDVNYNAEVTHRHDLSGYSPDELDALEKLVGKAANGAGDTGRAGEARTGRIH
jgi:hypothetical protein